MASNSTDIEKVTKTMMKLNTGKDKLNDMMMMADTSVSWDQFISPAPNSIAILGQLMLLSCKKDFSLETAKSGGFKYLTFPKSFRATLVQVSGAGFKAFNTADANMLEIMLLTSNVSDHIRNATKCLVVGTPEDIESTMPLILKKVDRVANECLKLSSEIVQSFEYVGDVLTEIYQTCLVKDTQNKEELDKQKLKIQDYEKMKDQLKKNVDQAEDEYTEFERKLKSAESEYTKAIDSMPSGGAIVAMSMANTLISSTCNLIQVVGPAVVGATLGPVGMGLASIGNAVANIPALMKNGPQPTNQTNVQESPSPNPQGNLQKSKNEKEVLEKMATFHSRIQELNDLYGSKDTPPKDIKLLVNYLKQQCEDKLKELAKYLKDSDIANRCSDLLEDLASCCEKINTSYKINASESTEEIKIRLNKISKRSNELKTRGDHILGDRGLSTPLPSQGKIMNDQINTTSKNSIDSWVKNSQFKVEQTRQNLEQMRNLKREQNTIKQEAHEKFLKLLRQLEKANTEELNLDEIKNILEEGIKTMANLKDKWNLLTNFFKRISAIIKATISVNLKDFKELLEVEAALKLESETYTLSKFKRDTIFQNAFTACATAYFVNRIAKTYNDVSQNHLIGPLSALDKLVTFDPVREQEQITFESSKIINQCEEAQEFIRKLVEKSCTELEEYSEQRMKQIESELGSILPPLEQEVVLSIKEETRKAAKQEKETNTNMDYESFSF